MAPADLWPGGRKLLQQGSEPRMWVLQHIGGAELDFKWVQDEGLGLDGFRSYKE